MPKKKPAPLPDSLRHLQPFVNSLAKLPPDDLREDVDASRLEATLRKRLRGMDEDAAEVLLAEDRVQLELWLRGEPDHPAHWVLGYLLSPDIAAHLTQPPVPPVRGPQMSFEAPAGWKLKPVPFRLDLKAGKVLGSIMAVEEFVFHLHQRQHEAAGQVEQPGVQATLETSEVSFGPCRGKKYVYLMTVPRPWKEVKYELSVPGGFVSISLGTMTGADFDESPLESKFHTLRLSAGG